MTASSLTTIWCDAPVHACGMRPGDDCPQWVAHEPTAAEARAIARSEGWKRIEGKDYSPQCAALLGGGAA